MAQCRDGELRARELMPRLVERALLQTDAFAKATFLHGVAAGYSAVIDKVDHRVVWNHTVVFTPAEDSVMVTVKGVDAQGKPAQNLWTGKFDGADYPVIGDPNADTRSYKKIDDRTLQFTNKKGDKVTLTGRIVVVAADGKSRIVTASGTDPKGGKFSSTAVYAKQ